MPVETYSDKLKNPKWQRCRLEVMQRDNFTCTLCGDDRTTLNVHHEDYSGNPWEISHELLKTVCQHCHAVIHKLSEYKITNIHKKISINRRCWEVVALTTTDTVYLYLFFDTNEYTDKTEIITVTPNNKAA